MKAQPAITEHLVLRQEFDARRMTCLFVTHSPDCSVKPHVAHHVRALINAGFQVILILNTDSFSAAQRMAGFQDPSGLIVRRNEGFDFGAWADALRLYPSLWDCSRLLLVNDSVIGPAGGGARLFERLLSLDADFVGLVESHEFVRHFQSFFLLLNQGALQSASMRSFWNSVVNFQKKDDVIRTYELKLTEFCVRSNLRTRAAFQQNILARTISKANPMIVHWRETIRAGNPYVKIELVKNIRSEAVLADLKRLLGDPELVALIDGFSRLRQR